MGSTAVIKLSSYPFTLDGKRVEWQFKRDSTNMFIPVASLKTSRHYTTPEYALVITNITYDDSGTYQAVIKDSNSMEVTPIEIKQITVPKNEADQKGQLAINFFFVC